MGEPVEGGADGGGLFEKLPGAYREGPGLLRPLLEAADDLLAATRFALRQEEERISGTRSVAPPGVWRRAFSEKAVGGEAGTLAYVLSSLAERIPARPLIWNGLEALALDDGALELRRSSRPGVVFAWDREQMGSPPAEPLVAADILPVGVRVQAVWLAKVDKALPRALPPDGARVSGEIFWSWGS